MNEEEALHVRKRQSLVRISHDDRIRVGDANCVEDVNCVTITICDYMLVAFMLFQMHILR